MKRPSNLCLIEYLLNLSNYSGRPVKWQLEFYNARCSPAGISEKGFLGETDDAGI